MTSQAINISGREAITRFQNHIQQLPQFEPEIKHIFADGLYAREMFMPRTCIVVGKIHLLEHLCIISQGVVKVVTESDSKIIYAPYAFVSLKGTKRALYAIQDTVWTTIHATDETDIEIIESTFVADEYTKEVLALLGDK